MTTKDYDAIVAKYKTTRAHIEEAIEIAKQNGDAARITQLNAELTRVIVLSAEVYRLREDAILDIPLRDAIANLRAHTKTANQVAQRIQKNAGRMTEIAGVLDDVMNIVTRVKALF